MECKSEDWDVIRKEMKDEFNSNKLYSDEKILKNVWGEGEKRQDLIDSLSWKQKGQQAPLKYWMTFPAHGYLLADTYKRPVRLFSKESPSTYLPLSNIPSNNPPICLILLTELSHLIMFSFKAKIWPSPRIDPYWQFYFNDEAWASEDWIQPNMDPRQEVLYPVRRSSRLNNLPIINVE